MAVLAGNFYAHPTREMCLVGVTGTNGKTTTAHLVESILVADGLETALFGTVDHRWPGHSEKARHTTPEAPDLERMLRAALDAGSRHAVMEVSSHAIALDRVGCLEFDLAAFTNISGEHLDFHGGQRAYFETKRRLFEGMSGGPPSIAVINRDDSTFEELASCGSPTVMSFGMTPEADVYPSDFQVQWSGVRAAYQTPFGEIRVESRLVGRVNLYNLGAAVAIATALDVPPASIAAGVASLHGVPGRFESIDCGQPFRVVVDFAHTDHALQRTLETGRALTRGRVIVVFGAGGDRDIEKRSRMGAVAAKHADFAIVTSDNPRREDPLRIIQMVESGLKKHADSYLCVEDRREAIRRGFEAARPGDTVVIAGKGHETGQIVGETVLPFDDRAVARELLDELVARSHR